MSPPGDRGLGGHPLDPQAAHVAGDGLGGRPGARIVPHEVDDRACPCWPSVESVASPSRVPDRFERRRHLPGRAADPAGIGDDDGRRPSPADAWSSAPPSSAVVPFPSAAVVSGPATVVPGATIAGRAVVVVEDRTQDQEAGDDGDDGEHDAERRTDRGTGVADRGAAARHSVRPDPILRYVAHGRPDADASESRCQRTSGRQLAGSVRRGRGTRRTACAGIVASGVDQPGAPRSGAARRLRQRIRHAPVGELPARPFLIGVAGGSSSGKTTVSERLAELAGERHLALIKLDSYYVDLGDRPLDERRGVQLRPSGRVRLGRCSTTTSPPSPPAQPCPSRSTTTTQYNRSGQVRMVRPARIVVVEGILVLWEPSLRDRFDLKVFMDADADLRLIRRLRRDIAERGPHRRERDRAVPDDGAPGPRAVHRAEQALRRRDHPRGRPQPPGRRRPARPGPRARGLTRSVVRIGPIRSLSNDSDGSGRASSSRGPPPPSGASPRSSNR